MEMLMRVLTASLARRALPTLALLAVVVFLPDSARAQQPAAAAAMNLFASAGDISALIAKAKAERKPDQANFIQAVVTAPGYRMNLEYRVGGIKAPASVHEKEAEIFIVVEGAGTAVTGGTLRDGTRTNPENLSGAAIDGGQSRPLAKGDVLFVPEGSPHWFDPAPGGTLVLLSLHMPHWVH